MISKILKNVSKTRSVELVGQLIFFRLEPQRSRYMMIDWSSTCFLFKNLTPGIVSQMRQIYTNLPNLPPSTYG